MDHTSERGARPNPSLPQGRNKVLEISARHRASLDLDHVERAKGGNAALQEAWEKLMQELSDKGLVKVGTELSVLKRLIYDQRQAYKKKARRVCDRVLGVAWSEADLPLIQDNDFLVEPQDQHDSCNCQAFAPLAGLTVGAEAVANDGGGDAGSGGDPWGLLDCHPWLARQRGYFILLYHGKECPAPDGLCQRSRDMSDCQKDKLLWNHFSTCPNTHCAQLVCMIRRHMLQHYKDCINERCPMCNLIKQWFPDFGMALAGTVRKQALRSNLWSPSSTRHHAQGVLAAKQTEQHVAQLQLPGDLQFADCRQQELRRGYSGDLTDERFQAARQFVERSCLLDCKIAAESEMQLLRAPIRDVQVPHEMQQSTGDPTDDERFQAARDFVERARLLDIKKLSESEPQFLGDETHNI